MSLSPKQKLISNDIAQKCNELTNDSCFKARKGFDKAKEGFVKFPANMGRQIIFMNIKKQYKITFQLLEKAFQEWNFYKIAEIRDQLKESYAVDILTGDTLGNMSTVFTQTQGNLILKDHHSTVMS